ncbi:MAG: NADH-quinone oxidoreductase subunit I [Anaerolineaceae bacterium]
MKGILKGLGVTLSTFSRKPVTVEYPDDKHPLSVRQRSFPVLLWDFDHEEPMCTGCNICVRNCPVDCMTAVMIDNPKVPEGTSNRRKIVDKFWIDYGRCMRCNICVEVCPFEAIVMDNSWGGPEQSAYDRRDLHMDIDDLLYPHKSGQVTLPFRPQDSIELLEKTVRGEAPPVTPFKGALPEDRIAQQERVARGEGAAIQERPAEVKAVTARASGGATAGGEEVEILSESKIRAKRMRAEREAKEFTDRGEPVPAEVTARIQHYANMKPGEAASGAAGGGGGGGGVGELLSGTLPDGSMRFPPGVGEGPKGDPNSPEKVRARRMRAERKFNELTASGEAIPEDVSQTLHDLGSDLAPGGSIWASLAGSGGTGNGGGGGGAPSSGPLTGTMPDGSMRFPPGVGDGPKGDPNSPEKVRARRMRAERKFNELTAAGEVIPDDIATMLHDLGSDLAPGGSIWTSLAPSAPPASGGGAAVAAVDDGKVTLPPGIGIGPKGDPNSPDKVRARRMRAERKAKELVAAGEPVPDDIAQTIRELGGTVPGAG